MTDCPICDFPIVWSETHERHWCSVYGWHRRERFKGPNVMLGAGPISELIGVSVHTPRCASVHDSPEIHTLHTSVHTPAPGRLRTGGDHP